MISDAPHCHAVGQRIRRLRQTKGLSRSELAHKIGVDVSSIAGWENGKRLPRESVRPNLARLLDCDLAQLLSPEEEPDHSSSVSVLNVSTEFPQLFAERIRKARHTLRAMRFAIPYRTAVNMYWDARCAISERILAGTLEVQRVEVFYSLERLKETLSNVLRYDGKPFYVKAACVGQIEIAPFLGGYCFDDSELFLGGYWTGIPPQGHPVLHIRGPVIGNFFHCYWSGIWGRGLLLNPYGARDLSAMKKVALQMGLPARRWKTFVDEAQELDIGDGAPPVI